MTDDPEPPDRLRRVGARSVRAVFGDRVGVVVFLSALVVFGVVLQAGTIINDTFTLVNTLVALSNGRFHVARVPVSGAAALPHVETFSPGLHVRDGHVYGRNYGQVFFALPFLLGLWGLAAVADLTVALLAAWCLTLLGAVVLAGRELGEERRFTVAGVVGSAALFGINVPFARAFPADLIPVLALQLSTMVAAALTAVVLYRLVSRIHGRRPGVFAGVGAVVASPVLLWSTVPKRHSLVALLAVATAYSFYRSRAATAHRRATAFRALAYAFVGLSLWVYAVDGLVLLAALGAVDVATARRNGARTLGVVAGAFLLSLVPFLVTNLVVAGNPLKPPVLVTRYAGPSRTPSPTPNPYFSGHVDGVRRLFLVAVTEIVGSLVDPGTLFQVFVRSVYPAEIPVGTDTAKDLSITESMPVVGALVGLAVLAGRRLRSSTAAARDRWTGARSTLRRVRRAFPGLAPERATDLLLAVYAAGFVAFYLPFLPVHASFSVRYLHPVYLVFAYALVRTGYVRRALLEHARTAIWAYAATVLVGGQLLVLWIWWRASTLAAVSQLFAQLSLAVAGGLAVWGVTMTARDWVGSEFLPFGAAGLGTAAGVSSVYYFLFSGTFGAAEFYVLPLVRAIFTNLPLV